MPAPCAPPAPRSSAEELGNQTGGPAGDWGAGSLHLSLGWTVGSAESNVTVQGQGMEKSTMLQGTFWLKLPPARLSCGLSLLNKAFPFLLGFWRLSCFLVLSVRLAGSRGSGRCPPWRYSRPACAWQSIPPAGQCSPGSFCWDGAGHGSLSTVNEELGSPCSWEGCWCSPAPSREDLPRDHGRLASSVLEVNNNRTRQHIMAPYLVERFTTEARGAGRNCLNHLE